MPGPMMTTAGGTEMDMSSPEAKQLFYAIAAGDPRFVQLMGDYRTGKAADPPSGSYNYTAGADRTPSEAEILQWYLDRLKMNVQGQRVAPGKVMPTKPEYSGELPGTAGEANPLLQELLGQGK